MRYLILPLFLLLLTVVLSAQRTTEWGLFLGASNYQGDFAATPVSLNETGLALGGIYQHSLDPNWVVKGTITYGQISGKDSNHFVDAQRDRDWSFRAGIFELAGHLQYHPLGKARYNAYGAFRSHVSPFASLGLGLTFAKANITRPANDLRANPEPNDRNTFIAIPVSAGIRWVMTEKLTLTGEFGQRAIFSDYLDGVSQNGNASTNDWYMFLGLGITYTLMAEY